MVNLTVAVITFIRNYNGCIFVCFLFPAFTVQNRTLLANENTKEQEMQVLLTFQSGKQIIRSVLPHCEKQLDIIYWKCWCQPTHLSSFSLTSPMQLEEPKTKPKTTTKPNNNKNLFTCIFTHILFSFFSMVQFLSKIQCLQTSHSHVIKTGAIVEAEQLYRYNKT